MIPLSDAYRQSWYIAPREIYKQIFQEMLNRQPSWMFLIIEAKMRVSMKKSCNGLTAIVASGSFYGAGALIGAEEVAMASRQLWLVEDAPWRIRMGSEMSCNGLTAIVASGRARELKRCLWNM